MLIFPVIFRLSLNNAERVIIEQVNKFILNAFFFKKKVEL